MITRTLPCTLGALLLLLGLTASAASQATVVPTDVQMPGTQPEELFDNLLPATECALCHGDYDPVAEPYDPWRGSMMSQAARDPIFWAAVAVAEQDVSGSADLCLRCHTPGAWLAGRSVPTDGSALLDIDVDAVSCGLCHRLSNPDGSEWIGVQNAPFLAHDGGAPAEGYYGSAQYVVSADAQPRFGPYGDAVAPHAWEQAEFVRNPQLCGTCHDVSNPLVGDLAPNNGATVPLDPATYDGFPGSNVDRKAAFNNKPHQYGVVERTFSEHQASAFNGMPVADYTSLPPELQTGSIRSAYEAALVADPQGNYEDGTTRTFSCQSCHMKPTTGRGCNLGDFIPLRTDLPQHDLTGANFFMPAAIEYLDSPAGPGLLIGGGMDASALAALEAGRQRALQTLSEAVSLSFDGRTLVVVNATGHKFPTGYPEGRRVYVRAEWRDDDDQIIAVDGGNETIMPLVDGVPTPVEVLDEETSPRIWQATHGISQEWAHKLVHLLGVSPDLPLVYDRVTGEVLETLGELADMPPGTVEESFHFVLNDTVMTDNRIPPYGYRYDDALTRNALPLPDTQYGDPGAGGVYEHTDRIPLQAPEGATRATIEVMYEGVTWEYAWFLKLANDGSVPFLASEGDRFMDAWLNSDVSTEAVVASVEWVDPWRNLEQGLAGSNGLSVLKGAGTLEVGTPVVLGLTNAQAGASTWLVVGFAELNQPFNGGVLVPDLAPPGFVQALGSGHPGALQISGTWPAGVPAEFTTWFQCWVEDPGGPLGWAASNGLSGTTPAD